MIEGHIPIMKNLLTSALMFAVLACPAFASDDAPSCPACPKKGDKAEPSAFITQDDCSPCKGGKKKDGVKEDAPAA